MIAKHGISYQGAQKRSVNSDTLYYPGNFLCIARQVKHHYFLLYERVRSTLQKYFFCMSPPNQNEMIGIVLQNTSFKYALKNKTPYIYIYIYIYIYKKYIYSLIFSYAFEMSMWYFIL